MLFNKLYKRLVVADTALHVTHEIMVGSWTVQLWKTKQFDSTYSVALKIC